jgi:hypothetical protein
MTPYAALHEIVIQARGVDAMGALGALARILSAAEAALAEREPEPETLLPCPFCGADPILHGNNNPPGVPAHRPVECPTADCVMSRAWPDVNAWQNRAYIANAPASPATNTAAPSVEGSGHEVGAPSASPATNTAESVEDTEE